MNGRRELPSMTEQIRFGEQITEKLRTYTASLEDEAIKANLIKLADEIDLLCDDEVAYACTQVRNEYEDE